MMALSGLFILMTQHGLEYPKFYEKLYALLTPAVFMAKHRSVFLQVSGKRLQLFFRWNSHEMYCLNVDYHSWHDN